MTIRHTVLATLALAAVTACGRKGARSADFDSATAAALAAGGGAAMANLPKVGHVMSFELAHGVDSTHMPYGGATQTFESSDSVFVSIRTIFVPAGANLTVQVMSGKQVLDSARTTSTAADTSGVARMSVSFAPPTAKGWTAGAYEAQVYLDGKFQVSRPFEIRKPN
ncbi:MAG TPA: hypothetical protein VGM77_01025 [Gemmatimonadales bacterium]|jgi:hypothetical protein